MSSHISDKTWIPIGSIAVVFGASMWITAVWLQGVANAEELKSFKEDVSKKDDKIYYKLEKMDEKIDKILEKKNGN